MSYQICVSGAAHGPSVEQGHKLAYELGQEVAKSGHTLMTGATIGLPNRAAEGAKSEGGKSIGISPAASVHEHVEKYRLPTKSYDTIIYSGLHYIGRDVLLVNSSEAVLVVGGRLGTLHEFVVAMETHKIIGVLDGAGGTSADFPHIIAIAGIKNHENLIFESDAKILVEKVTKMLDKEHRDHGYLHKK